MNSFSPTHRKKRFNPCKENIWFYASKIDISVIITLKLLTAFHFDNRIYWKRNCVKLGTFSMMQTNQRLSIWKENYNGWKITFYGKYCCSNFGSTLICFHPSHGKKYLFIPGNDTRCSHLNLFSIPEGFKCIIKV